MRLVVELAVIVCFHHGFRACVQDTLATNRIRHVRFFRTYVRQKVEHLPGLPAFDMSSELKTFNFGDTVRHVEFNFVVGVYEPRIESRKFLIINDDSLCTFSDQCIECLSPALHVYHS